jgi:hypothetical protein
MTACSRLSSTRLGWRPAPEARPGPLSEEVEHASRTGPLVAAAGRRSPAPRTGEPDSLAEGFGGNALGRRGAVVPEEDLDCQFAETVVGDREDFAERLIEEFPLRLPCVGADSPAVVAARDLDIGVAE